MAAVQRPRCHFLACKQPVTHTVQRLWTIPGRKPFALQYCCDAHIPGSFDRDSSFMRAVRNHGKGLSPFYRVECLTSITYPTGARVRYARPEAGEESLTFTVIEDRGDRVLLESRDFPDARFKPQELISKADVCA